MVDYREGTFEGGAKGLGFSPGKIDRKARPKPGERIEKFVRLSGNIYL